MNTTSVVTHTESPKHSISWVNELMHASYAQLQKIGLPTRHNEAWRHTPITRGLNLPLQSARLTYEPLSSSAQVLFQNGHAKTYQLPQGVTTVQETELPKTPLHDNKLVYQDDPFYLLATSHSAPTLMKIDGNINEAIHLHHHFQGENGQLASGHLLVEVADNSRVCVFQHITGTGEHLSTQATTFLVGKNATVEHVILQSEDKTTRFVHTVNTKLAQGANYRSVILQTTAKLARHSHGVELTGSGAHAEVHGLSLLKDNQLSDIHSIIRHMHAHTTSSQLVKGIYSENSNGVFTGRVYIAKDAQQVDAKQLNRNLLLSSKAHAIGRPELEIFADDVKCSHGHSTGALQDDELFYLQSRGIPANRARAMVARGFGHEVMMKIEHPVVKKTVAAVIEQRLTELGGMP